MKQRYIFRRCFPTIAFLLFFMMMFLMFFPTLIYDESVPGDVPDYNSALRTLIPNNTLMISYDGIVEGKDAPGGALLTNFASDGTLFPDGMTLSQQSDVMAVEVVPEPSSLLFIGFGLLGIFVLTRKKYEKNK